MLVLFTGTGRGTPPVAFGLMLIVVLLLAALYTVGLSAVGGYLGVYFKGEL